MTVSAALAAPPSSSLAFAPDEYTSIDATAQDGGFVRELPDGTHEGWIAVEGMVCAACGQAVESQVSALPGVKSVRVSLMTERARIVWDAAATPPSDLFRAIRQAGYAPYPADSAELEAAQRQRSRLLFWRLLVAGLAMMQVMMYAWPEYIMSPGDIEPDVIRLLRWAQWMITLPVMLFCAWPIFGNAVHSLRRRRIGMDVPAALGILLAFFASSAATFDGSGEVWFDSVTMFVFFLLLARWLESAARARATLRLEALRRLLPTSVTRVHTDDDGSVQLQHVSPSQLVPGDIVQTAAGETFAADGYIVDGETEVDEALLTGESRPLAKPCGAWVRAGSVNVLAGVRVRVEHASTDSTLGQIRLLVDEAAAARPDWMRTADQWASVFLGGVLVVAALSWLGWQFIDPSRALSVAIAVLIVTCPCALSLATPAAMLAATTALARRGIWLRAPAALERLARIDHIAFDKTGTLTQGLPAVAAVVALRGDVNSAQALQTAAALATWSRHPLSRALVESGVRAGTAAQVQEFAGEGLTGTVDGVVYRLGNAEFTGVTQADLHAVPPDGGRPVTWLSDNKGIIARFAFDDPVREDAAAAVAELRQAGVQVALLSGDASDAVGRVAEQVQLDDARGGLAPADKLEILRTWQASGKTVAMVGDGINDGPALAGADISIVLNEAAPL
nr:cation-translocating P-type ATPase [Pseudomonas sp.]